MKEKIKIVFAAKDRGGFDAILPVIKKLEKNNAFNLFVILDNPAYQFARKENIKCSPGLNLPFSKIKKLITNISPDIIFTSTSRGLSIDKKFIKAARKDRIPTISIVDYWGNYKVRFGGKLEYLSDYILAVDKKMREELTRCKVPKDRIFVTGNPRFDKFSKIKRVKENKNLIIFYSQPFSERRDRNFNEIKVFEDTINALKNMYPKKEVIIKFHPAENNENKFDGIIKNADLKIKIEKRLGSDDLSKKAELIMGINSIALMDAALMQKRVISYQPGIKKKDDLLLSNKYGWSVPVYKKADLLPVLRSIFKKPLVKKRALEKYTKNNSTNKVIDVIYNTIGRFENRKKFLSS